MRKRLKEIATAAFAENETTAIAEFYAIKRGIQMSGVYIMECIGINVEIVCLRHSIKWIIRLSKCGSNAHFHV